MTNKILNAALIGVGNMGKKYVDMIVSGKVSNMKLTAIVIRRDELMEWGKSLINSRYLRTSHYHKSGLWRSSFAGEGGGALINQGQHILDMFQYIFGMPQRMFALIPFGKYNDFAVDDEDTIIMDYDNGMTATFILTTGEAVYEERMEIIGTKAKILLEDDILTITRHRDVEEYIKTENVNSRENMKFTQEVIEFAKQPEPYIELLEKFARSCIEHNDKYLVAGAEEGINSLMLCAGAYYSACTNMPVELPLDRYEYKKLMDELIAREQGIKNI